MGFLVLLLGVNCAFAALSTPLNRLQSVLSSRLWLLGSNDKTTNSPAFQHDTISPELCRLPPQHARHNQSHRNLTPKRVWVGKRGDMLSMSSATRIQCLHQLHHLCGLIFVKPEQMEETTTFPDSSNDFGVGFFESVLCLLPGPRESLWSTTDDPAL
jgi:hypothetical protein